MENKPKISIIVAIAKNRAIGKDNKLLWHIPNDLRRFKEITTGHTVIMGRKTHESIGKPLPNRTNIIITRNNDYKADGCIICKSLEDAIKFSKERQESEAFIIGGGEIYNQAINLADKLYLTLVEGDFEADTYFPDYSDFKKIVFEKQEESEGYKYRFLELER